MQPYGYENNLECQVMSASPVGLIQMLCHGALDALKEARAYLRTGDIARRSHRISKAQSILAELSVSLDRTRGGEIAAQLGDLYAYMQRRLVEANFRQADEPLAETERLLGTLTDAWDQCGTEAYGSHFPVPVVENYRAYECVG
jgi:flagellar protein FliS